MSLALGLLVAWVANWALPGCVESARCRRRGCRTCSILVPCDEALMRAGARTCVRLLRDRARRLTSHA